MELKKNINKLVLINIIGAEVVVFLIFKGGKVGIKGDIDISGIVMLIVLSILSMVSSFISSFWFKATIEKVKALFLSNLGILISSWFYSWSFIGEGGKNSLLIVLVFSFMIWLSSLFGYIANWIFSTLFKK